MKYFRSVSRLAPGAAVAAGLLALSLGGQTSNSDRYISQRGHLPLSSKSGRQRVPRGQIQDASLAAALARTRYGVTPAPTASRRKPGSGRFTAVNPSQALAMQFQPERVELTAPSRGGSGERRIALRTVAVGRGKDMQPVTAGPATARENRVEYAHRTAAGIAVTEWWVNKPEGVEQGWTVYGKAAGGRKKEEEDTALAASASVPSSVLSQPLEIDLAIEGDLRPEVTANGQAVAFRDGAGAAVLRGADLKAWDATGRSLPVRFRQEETGSTVATPASFHPSPLMPQPLLTIQVNDAGAVYPVTIDPTYTQTQKLTQPAGDAAAVDLLGSAVALDGDTAVVGAFGDTPDLGSGPINRAGAAYVFTRSGGTWTLQQKLTEPPGDAAPSDNFGISVAISGDSMVVGANTDAPDLGAGPIPYAGAAYVFTRTGGSWTLQQKLTLPSDDADGFETFGFSVSIDGDTLAVGATGESPDLGAGPLESAGAAYVFTRSAGAWALQQKLTEPVGDAALGDLFGVSVAVQGDTALVGAPGDTPDLGAGPIDSAGAAYVFTRSGTVWTQQAKLTEPAGEAAEREQLGIDVALDGDTAVASAPAETVDAVGEAGAVFVFTRSGPLWTVEQKLTQPPGDPIGEDLLGYAVAVHGDTVLAGAFGTGPDLGAGPLEGAGAAYVFTRSGGVWALQQRLTEAAGEIAPGDQFGRSVALDGGTALVGATGVTVNLGAGDLQDAGAVFTYELDANGPPVAQPDKTLTVLVNTVTGLGITAPTDPDGDALTVTVDTVPNPALGVVRKAGGGAVVAPNDPLTVAELTGLEFYPVLDQTGAAGTFSYTVDDGNGNSASQTITLQVSAITLTAPATGTTGIPLAVQWTAPPGQSAVDWIGFYRSDVPGPSGYLAWTWTGGTTTGAFTVTPPSPGTYVFRYYLNNGSTLAATSNLVTVSDPPGSAFTVTISPETAAPGQTVTISWSAPAGRPATDWIGLFPTGTPGPSGYLTWFYTGGTLTGSKTVAAPGTAGTYVARYYLQDGSTVATTSNPLTVTSSAPTYSVTPSATTVATGGTLMVNWTAPSGRPAHDWVALVRADQVQAGPPQVITGYVKWAYTGGATTGSAQFQLTGVAPGTYYCVYLLNDSTTTGAISTPVTVQ